MKHDPLNRCWLKTNSGALSGISGLFARRASHRSLAVGLPKQGKIVPGLTWWWKGIRSTLQQMNQGQLNKLRLNVLNVNDLTTMPFGERELMLVKVCGTAGADAPKSSN